MNASRMLKITVIFLLLILSLKFITLIVLKNNTFKDLKFLNLYFLLMLKYNQLINVKILSHAIINAQNMFLP
jgi:hypothetical protein